MIYRHTVLATFLSVTVFCTTVSAVSASVTGTVTDTHGSPVSGALVVFTDESDTNAELATISVYTITGQKVGTLVDGYLSSGSHTVTWNGIGDDGRQLAVGVYINQLRSGDRRLSKKMLLIDGGNISGATAGSSVHGSSRTNTFTRQVYKAENKSYHVRITGKDIVVFEESDVDVHEGESMNFVVKRLPGDLMLVAIPGGTFRMGDVESEGFSNEDPVHTVTVSGFEMSRTEITNAQYAEYLNEVLGLDYIFVNIIGEVYRKTDDYTGVLPDYTGAPQGYREMVHRGGSFNDLLFRCRSAYRGHWYPDYGDISLGFCVVRRP